MRSHPVPMRRQRGAVLVVSLLLLLVMTVLALTSSQATQMQERMAGNARDLDLAFQASEAGLIAAETRLGGEIADEGQASPVTDRTDAVENYHQQEQEWWDDNADEIKETLSNVKAQPQYALELWAKVPDTITKGSSMQQSGTMFYIATSRARGGTDTAVSIVETTYAVRY